MAKKKADKAAKDQKLIVEKQNIVNQATWFDPNRPTWENPITKQAYMFFLLYLSKINPRDPNTQSLVMTSHEYKEIMQFHHLNHVQVGRAVSLLFDLKIVIPSPDKPECDIFHVFNLLNYKTDPETKQFVLRFEPNMKAIPYLFDYLMRRKAPRFSAGDIKRGFDFLCALWRRVFIAPCGAGFLTNFH